MKLICPAEKKYKLPGMLIPSAGNRLVVIGSGPPKFKLVDIGEEVGRARSHSARIITLNAPEIRHIHRLHPWVSYTDYPGCEVTMFNINSTRGDFYVGKKRWCRGQDPKPVPDNGSCADTPSTIKPVSLARPPRMYKPGGVTNYPLPSFLQLRPTLRTGATAI